LNSGIGYLFLTLPGGGSWMTAQNTPSPLMAFTNLWKSTGFYYIGFPPVRLDLLLHLKAIDLW
jgi:hypothetical protein